MDLHVLSELVGDALLRREWMLATAESCTGGWIAKSVTDISGSSAWFERGFVTYTNLAKQEMLGVRAETLDTYGAVSEQTVREMAQGALAHSKAHIAVAVSGIAGPGGATLRKPVGMVCFAWGVRDATIQTATNYFQGDREHVRAQAVECALQGVLDALGRMV